MSADVALIGLAVMGQNLVLNMADHGINVAVYNRSAGVTEKFVSGPGNNGHISAYYSLGDLVGALERPRKLMICLLYTSPSPRDKRQSRMPSSA